MQNQIFDSVMLIIPILFSAEFVLVMQTSWLVSYLISNLNWAPLCGNEVTGTTPEWSTIKRLIQVNSRVLGNLFYNLIELASLQIHLRQSLVCSNAALGMQRRQFDLFDCLA